MEIKIKRSEILDYMEKLALEQWKNNRENMTKGQIAFLRCSLERERTEEEDKIYTVLIKES